jgi:hypothetical protein
MKIFEYTFFELQQVVPLVDGTIIHYRQIGTKRTGYDGDRQARIKLFYLHGQSFEGIPFAVLFVMFSLLVVFCHQLGFQYRLRIADHSVFGCLAQALATVVFAKTMSAATVDGKQILPLALIRIKNFI